MDRLREDILAGPARAGHGAVGGRARPRVRHEPRAAARSAWPARLRGSRHDHAAPRSRRAQLSREEFIDAYQVREALETLAVRLAVPLMSDAEISHLRELCELMDRAARDDEVHVFFDTNRASTRRSCAGRGTGSSTTSTAMLVGQMAPYLPRSLELRGNLQQSVAEHQAILAAIEERDSERAARLLAEHIEVPQRVLESDAGARSCFREDVTDIDEQEGSPSSSESTSTTASR